MSILYNTHAVAKKLNIRYRKVLDLIATGELEVRRRGRYYYVSENAIMCYLHCERVIANRRLRKK